MGKINRFRKDKILTKEELLKKVKFDLKCDRVMVILSIFFVTAAYLYWVYANVSIFYAGIAAVNFLLWLNAYLLTKRNKQMLEVEK